MSMQRDIDQLVSGTNLAVEYSRVSNTFRVFYIDVYESREIYKVDSSGWHMVVAFVMGFKACLKNVNGLDI